MVVFGRQLVLLCYLVWEVRVLGRKGGISIGVSISVVNVNGVIVFLIHPDRRGACVPFFGNIYHCQWEGSFGYSWGYII